MRLCGHAVRAHCVSRGGLFCCSSLASHSDAARRTLSTRTRSTRTLFRSTSSAQRRTRALASASLTCLLALQLINTFTRVVASQRSHASLHAQRVAQRVARRIVLDVNADSRQRVSRSSRHACTTLSLTSHMT